MLIRIKVLQILYSYYQNESTDLQAAEKELLFSLRKSYDLYHYFLLLIIDVTRLRQRIIENRKAKYVPSEEEKNPNMRLIDNRLTIQLEKNEALQEYISAQGISWSNDEEFVKDVLEQILASETYEEYLANPDDSYETDREFWRQIFRKEICGSNEKIEEYLENKSIYWNDDIEIVGSFVVKTLRQFEEKNESQQPLLPMFKELNDRDFAVRLLRQTLLNGDQYRERINRHMKNWETERIANMDLVIMQTAVAELMSFPSIPVSVTLNEYIDAAKYYSTPKSGIFINGILDAIVNELKKEKALFKN